LPLLAFLLTFLLFLAIY